ncbi:hypothetical protein ACH52_2491 [Eubacterium limosum]|nr:hypothetical protein ACH52_2491 [Eubacterium limosum]
MKIKKYLVLFMLVLIIAVSAGFFTSQLGHFKKVADWGADRGQAGPSEPEEPPPGGGELPDRGEEAAPAEEPETPPRRRTRLWPLPISPGTSTAATARAPATAGPAR